MLKKIWNLIAFPYRAIADQISYRRKVREARKNDPFIYK